jgi:predicted lipid-binding transport protein (Tim44 family)
MPTQFIDIILLAMVAGFIAFKLYTVLGRRTGHERSPEEQVRVPDPVRAKKPAAAKDNVVTLPERGSLGAAAPTGPLARGLMDIKLADRGFDDDRFLDGARAAHEMIVTAYAKGDRESLRPLVNDDVYAAFEGGIKGREQRKERVDFEFVRLKAARITAAELKNRTAEITVALESEIILAAYDQSGRLIEGEPSTPHTVTDVWTFARDTKSRDPNWTLVATGSA